MKTPKPPSHFTTTCLHTLKLWLDICGPVGQMLATVVHMAQNRRQHLIDIANDPTARAEGYRRVRGPEESSKEPS